MSYAERAYFENDHCAHVAVWQERHLLAGRHSRAYQAMRGHERRMGGRATR